MLGLTTPARPDNTKPGTNPIRRLANTTQEQDRICTTLTTRRKQAQYHYDHLMLITRDSNDDAKKRHYQSLQEALREATRDHHMQKQEFLSELFSALPTERHDGFEKV